MTLCPDGSLVGGAGATAAALMGVGCEETEEGVEEVWRACSADRGAVSEDSESSEEPLWADVRLLLELRVELAGLDRLGHLLGNAALDGDAGRGGRSDDFLDAGLEGGAEEAAALHLRDLDAVLDREVP